MMISGFKAEVTHSLLNMSALHNTLRSKFRYKDPILFWQNVVLKICKSINQCPNSIILIFLCHNCHNHKLCTISCNKSFREEINSRPTITKHCKSDHGWVSSVLNLRKSWKNVRMQKW